MISGNTPAWPGSLSSTEPPRRVSANAAATSMRWLPWVLLALLALLQYRLWMGDGSLAEVWNLYQQVETQKRENRELRDRNQALEAEVVDLKQGLDAIEERAREELGMIREDETFYQIVEEPEREESARP